MGEPAIAEVAVLFNWNLSRYPFLGQVIDLDLKLCTGFDSENHDEDLFLCLIFNSETNA